MIITGMLLGADPCCFEDFDFVFFFFSWCDGMATLRCGKGGHSPQAGADWAHEPRPALATMHASLNDMHDWIVGNATKLILHDCSSHKVSGAQMEYRRDGMLA